MAIPLSDTHTASFTIDVCSHPLNWLFGHEWNKKLISIETDGAVNMTRG